jgi:protoheme ferro-lyase
MVFLNMGGPSTTAEVEDFLGRLFVRSKESRSSYDISGEDEI